MSEIPALMAELIKEAKDEGFVVTTERVPLRGGGYSTLVKLAHPDNPEVEWTETGFPDFFPADLLRETFRDHKFSALKNWDKYKAKD